MYGVGILFPGHPYIESATALSNSHGILIFCVARIYNYTGTYTTQGFRPQLLYSSNVNLHQINSLKPKCHMLHPLPN